jgi:hypothetical protein
MASAGSGSGGCNSLSRRLREHPDQRLGQDAEHADDCFADTDQSGLVAPHCFGHCLQLFGRGRGQRS